jgi:hypothetical protein
LQSPPTHGSMLAKKKKCYIREKDSADTYPDYSGDHEE